MDEPLYAALVASAARNERTLSEEIRCLLRSKFRPMSKRTTQISRMSVEEAMGENLRLGYVELFGVNENGEPLWRITPEGEQHVQMMLQGSE